MMLEKLEARCFLSVTAMLKHGVLFVFGTQHADDIHVNVSFIPVNPAASVTANGRTIYSAGGQDRHLPSSVVLKGRGGNDKLSISANFNSFPLRATVRGGDGDDEIVLNSNYGFPAKIWGNEGNDKIVLTGGGISNDGSGYSNWSYDVNVHGGAGDDIIEHHARYDDTLTPRGYARLFGDAGDDLIIGGQTMDRLQGGGGDDTLRGEGGGDLLIGGAGDDHIIGGPGDDVIHQGSPSWSLRM
jgi:Ca2+-binding RTX toxin-like protein